MTSVYLSSPMVLRRGLTMDRKRPLQRLMTSVRTVGRTSGACFASPRVHHIRPHQNSTTAVVLLLTTAIWSCLSTAVQSDGCVSNCTGCSAETCCSQGFYWNASESSSTTASNTLSTSNSATSWQLTENSATSTPASSMQTSGPADSCCGGYCLPCNKTLTKCIMCSYSKTTNTVKCSLCQPPLIINTTKNECELISGSSDTYKFVIVGVFCGVVVVALLLALVIVGFRKGWWKYVPWPFGAGGGGVNNKPSVPRPEDCDWPPPPSVNMGKNTVKRPTRYTRTPSNEERRRNNRQPGNGRQAIPSVVYDGPASQDVHELSTVQPVTPTSKTTTTGQGKGLSRPGNTSVKIHQRHDIVSMEPLDADQELYQNFAPTSHVIPADQSTTSHAKVENGGRRNVHHLMTSSSTDVNDELYMNGPEPPATMTSPTPVPVRIVNGNVGSGSLPNASDNDESEYGNQFEIKLALRQMQQQQQQPAENDGDQEVYANAETFSQDRPPPVAPRPTAHRH